MAYQPINDELKTVGDCWKVSDKYNVPRMIENIFEVADNILTVEKQRDGLLMAANIAIDVNPYDPQQVFDAVKELNDAIQKAGGK